MIIKHKSNKIKENSNTVRHLNNGTDHRHSKSCCDQSSPARRTMIQGIKLVLRCRLTSIGFPIIKMRRSHDVSSLYGNPYTGETAF